MNGTLLSICTNSRKGSLKVFREMATTTRTQVEQDMSLHALGHIYVKLNSRRRLRTTFVIVEGSDDLAFYRRFFDRRVTSVYYSTKLDDKGNVKDGGCKVLMEIVDTVLKDGRTDQVIGIIDTDYRKYRKNHKYPKNIFHTDRRDMEMTTLETVSVRHYLCDWIQDFDSKLEKLEPILRHAGELRIVNDLFRMGCNFKKGCKISSTFDQQKHRVYDDWKRRYDCMFLKACFYKKGQKTEKLKALVRLCKAYLHLKCHTYKHESMYDICQGHDTVSLLSLSLVNTATYSEAAIWEKCFDAYTVADFANSDLYLSINEWQTAKGLSIFKKAVNN